jgi:hypothetical protein
VTFCAAGDLYGNGSAKERRQDFLEGAAKKTESLTMNAGEDSNNDI